jgi:hypothetical protein
MKQLFLLLTIVAILFVGCKKDEDAYGGKIILKYEVISTLPFQSISTSSFSLMVGYTNATGQMQYEQLNITGKTWTKTVELTTNQRPLSIMLGGSGFTSGTTGTVTANVYENGVLKANTVSGISATALQGIGQVSINQIFYVKQ